MDRCRYPSKPCLNARAVKLNGELHRFCEQHRRQANQNQMRWSKRKQTVLRVRRGDGDDHDDDARENQGDSPLPRQAQAPPPPPMGLPHGLGVNITAAGASLSHLSLNAPAPPPPLNGGLISSFQDHVARGGAIPGTNGVNLVLSGGGVRRELAPAPLRVPPIQTALPPLLPPRADQPDPTAVHALLMLEHAANVVSHDGDDGEPDDGQVRRELKRAKSNEWIARPTLSPAGLPTVASLVPPPASSAPAPTSNPTASVSAIGRSASWQPPVRDDPRRESLGQWMQRKQASLPSLSNITRIEKRPYDSISSSAPSSASGYLHRGVENSGDAVSNYNAPPHRSPYHVPHHQVTATKSSNSSDPAADSGKRTALV